METNTVLLDLETYNKLRDFHKKFKNVPKDKFIVVETGSSRYSELFFTSDEAIERIAKVNHHMNRQIEQFEKELERVRKREELTERDVNFDRFKTMTCREFRKWKKSLINK